MKTYIKEISQGNFPDLRSFQTERTHWVSFNGREYNHVWAYRLEIFKHCGYDNQKKKSWERERLHQGSQVENDLGLLNITGN